MKYDDQWAAAKDPLIRHRVNMGAYTAAINAFSNSTAPTAPTTIGQRQALVSALLQNESYGEETFINFVVRDPAISNRDGITDTQINGLLTNDVFDNIAYILFPGI